MNDYGVGSNCSYGHQEAVQDIGERLQEFKIAAVEMLGFELVRRRMIF